MKILEELYDNINRTHDKFYKRFNFYKNIYFECGEGWFNLIWELSENIEKELINNNITDFTVLQVKQKFGTLRYYFSGGNDKIYELIKEAEIKSETICEECGKDGKIRKLGYIYTLCNECYKKQIYKIAENNTSKNKDGIPIIPKDDEWLKDDYKELD